MIARSSRGAGALVLSAVLMSTPTTHKKKSALQGTDFKVVLKT
jgi:hypothetical protein